MFCWAWRLLERLPGPQKWTFAVKLTILQTGTYKAFMQQCQENAADVRRQEAWHRRFRQQGRRRRRRPRRRSEQSLETNSEDSRPTNGSRSLCVESERSPDASPLAVALSWARLARLHRLIMCTIYLYIVLKFLLVELVCWPSSSLAYLDCLVLGRFRFLGRSNRISGEIASVFMAVFSVYRWSVHLLVPKFKFCALEFMMYDRDEVANCELRFEHTNSPASLPMVTSQHNHTVRNNSLGLPVACERDPPVSCRSLGPSDQQQQQQQHQCHLQGHLPERRLAAQPGPFKVNSIFYLRNPFELNDSTWILRPNRTERNWHLLNMFTKAIFYCSVGEVVVWVVLVNWAISGSVLTNLGFEMAYPGCVAWLRDLQRPGAGGPVSNQPNYSHLYAAPKVLAHESPIDDIPAFIPLDTLSFQQVNPYYLTRLLFDLLENHFIYLEFIFQFVGQFFTLVINSIDVVLNATEIRLRLARILEQLEKRRSLSQLLDNKAQCYSRFLEVQEDPGPAGSKAEGAPGRRRVATLCWRPISPLWPPPEGAAERPPLDRMALLRDNVDQMHFWENQDERLGEEISDLQAILADHFENITRGYNLYNSYFVNFLLFLWMSYTVVVCTWMGMIKSRAVELEFVLVELGGTLFTVCFLSGVAFVRRYNVGLYPLITSAMALDPDCSLTKQRWITILSYYSPRPLYCFTIFGATELSWMLCLKLLFWVLSAFIVLANFYYMNRV